MKQEIINWYIKNNIEPPKDNRDIINATYLSLANSYKIAIDELESITNEKYDELYIVGGGAKNTYLNKLTQQLTNKKVIALPIEATAIGNLLIQMKGKVV
jgi:sugar (pentulose or hexulose) kinase